MIRTRLSQKTLKNRGGLVAAMSDPVQRFLKMARQPDRRVVTAEQLRVMTEVCPPRPAFPSRCSLTF